MMVSPGCRKRGLMSIKDVSEARRMPRLGKIHLGIKVDVPGKTPYPKATDHFVVPDEIKQFIGDQPKELQIMFPSDDMELIAPQYLRCYGLTHGLVCWGDGDRGHRKLDVKTHKIAGRDTLDWEWQDWECNTAECPEYGARCRRVMNLIFLMPNIPGLGVWQLDTSSFYSIREVNSTLEMIMNMTGGRIAFIPLTLALGPVKVHPPGEKEKTVQILHIKSNVLLADVIKHAQLAPGKVLIEIDFDERPEDLFPTALVAGAEEEVVDHETEQKRLDEWRTIIKLGKKLKVTGNTLRSYFGQVHEVSIPLNEYVKEGGKELADTPPKALSLDLLITLREYLQEHQMDLG